MSGPRDSHSGRRHGGPGIHSTGGDTTAAPALSTSPKATPLAPGVTYSTNVSFTRPQLFVMREVIDGPGVEVEVEVTGPTQQDSDDGSPSRSVPVRAYVSWASTASPRRFQWRTDATGRVVIHPATDPRLTKRVVPGVPVTLYIALFPAETGGSEPGSARRIEASLHVAINRSDPAPTSSRRTTKVVAGFPGSVSPTRRGGAASPTKGGGGAAANWANVGEFGFSAAARVTTVSSVKQAVDARLHAARTEVAVMQDLERRVAEAKAATGKRKATAALWGRMRTLVDREVNPDKWRARKARLARERLERARPRCPCSPVTLLHSGTAHRARKWLTVLALAARAQSQRAAVLAVRSGMPWLLQAQPLPPADDDEVARVAHRIWLNKAASGHATPARGLPHSPPSRAGRSSAAPATATGGSGGADSDGRTPEGGSDAEDGYGTEEEEEARAIVARQLLHTAPPSVVADQQVGNSRVHGRTVASPIDARGGRARSTSPRSQVSNRDPETVAAAASLPAAVRARIGARLASLLRETRRQRAQQQQQKQQQRHSGAAVGSPHRRGKGAAAKRDVSHSPLRPSTAAMARMQELAALASADGNAVPHTSNDKVATPDPRSQLRAARRIQRRRRREQIAERQLQEAINNYRFSGAYITGRVVAVRRR